MQAAMITFICIDDIVFTMAQRYDSTFTTPRHNFPLVVVTASNHDVTSDSLSHLLL